MYFSYDVKRFWSIQYVFITIGTIFYQHLFRYCATLTYLVNIINIHINREYRKTDM